jgi:hypothetical protein
MRVGLVLGLIAAIGAAGCGKPSRPPAKVSTSKKPVPAPPPEAPAAEEPPKPIVPVVPESAKPKDVSPTGFRYGARDRVGAYLKDLELDPEKERRYNGMVDRRDRNGLLDQAADSFVYLLVRALDDDEGIARFCFETVVETSRKLNLVDEDGKVFEFKFERIQDPAYRSGWVATYLANLRDNPEVLKK